MEKNKYTPATINQCFTIPLYQRLFEWEEIEIAQLLNDLYSSFKKDASSPYYIGMLTVYKGDSEVKYSLVDGQQRFTVLSLMGIVFGWNEFLKSNNGYRLSFFARKNDERYLINKIENNELSYVNKKMEAGINCIKSFVDDPEKSDINSFKDYIRENTTFFISELPRDYTVQDLNGYFEAMNEAGKGLENYEILKVQLLSKTNDLKEQYTKIWNVVSEMDKCLIRQEENESQKDYRERNIKVFMEGKLSSIIVNSKNDEENSGKTTIYNIEASPTKPTENDYMRGERAILSFSDFLLQVLWLCLPKNERINATDFFNRFKLLETFNKFVIDEEGIVSVDSFFEKMLKFRILFDFFIIRLNNQDNRNTNYSLNMVVDGQDDNNNLSLKRSLIHYQSMLYVSTASHLWLTATLDYLYSYVEVNFEDSLSFLKIWDNIRHNKGLQSLKYGSIDRYWFWRLDYYLWENKETHFEDETSRKIANNYIFRTNRSIEHIAPQNPKSESKVNVDRVFLHSFGNLAMISAGQNSSLQNESFEVKHAHVSSFVNGSIGGSIESLKMLEIYKYNSWGDETIKKHHNEMLDVLINSFHENDDIRNALEKLKL